MAKSIKEIAEHLQVSKSTVSLVINGKAEKARISKALEQKILDYVELIGYKPNALAQSLATGKSRTIGLIVENIGDSFFGPFALYIEELFRKKGYHVLYSSTMGNDQNAKNIIDSMLEKKVEGIIIAPTSHLDQYIQKILAAGLPLVLFDRHIPAIPTYYVHTDNVTGIFEGCVALRNNGAKNIGFVTIDSRQNQMCERQDGYTIFCEKYGMANVTLEIAYNHMHDDGKSALLSWLASNPGLDALFFSTNYLCVMGLRTLVEHFKRVPYRIFSFDDHEMFDILQPPVSCIRQPLESLAKRCVELLLGQISGKYTASKEHVLPGKLILR